MITILSNIHQHSLALLGVGVIVVLVINLLKWRSDLAHARRFAQDLQEQPSLKSTATVSVLVAAWNEEAHIKKHIESFLRLRYPHKELILCAGGTDQTLAIALEYAAEKIFLLEQQHGEGKQNALRRCLAHARGEIIFLTDADCYLDDDSFERTLEPLIEDNEQVATGSMYPYRALEQNLFVMSQVIPQLYNTAYSEKYTRGILGCNCALIKAVLEKTQAFGVKAPTGTDYILAKTLMAYDIKIRKVPHSLMRSDYHTTINDYFHQQRRWAKNVYFYGKQFKAAREVNRIIINTMVGLLMLVLPLSIQFGLNLLSVLWALLFLYALFSRWRYMGTIKKVFGLLLPRAIMIFQPLMLLIDFAAWARPFPDLIFKTGKERW